MEPPKIGDFGNGKDASDRSLCVCVSFLEGTLVSTLFVFNENQEETVPTEATEQQGGFGFPGLHLLQLWLLGSLLN